MYLKFFVSQFNTKITSNLSGAGRVECLLLVSSCAVDLEIAERLYKKWTLQ
jgi:hypothetical protein